MKKRGFTMKHFDKNYLFSTSLDSSKDKDDFVIELYSITENQADLESLQPAKVIHNFDELISFFEELDEEMEAEELEPKELIRS